MSRVRLVALAWPESAQVAGMDAYVSKPFHVEEVFAAIDRVLMMRAV